VWFALLFPGYKTDKSIRLELALSFDSFGFNLCQETKYVCMTKSVLTK
jgi:hypothetical protein